MLMQALAAIRLALPVVPDKQVINSSGQQLLWLPNTFPVAINVQALVSVFASAPVLSKHQEGAEVRCRLPHQPAGIQVPAGQAWHQKPSASRLCRRQCLFQAKLLLNLSP